MSRQHRHLTKAELLRKIESAPDGALIVVPADDHSYREAHVEESTALFDGHGFSEDYGEDLTPEKEHGKRIPVIVIA